MNFLGTGRTNTSLPAGLAKERKKGKKTMKNRQKVSCEKIEKELTGSRNSVEWEPSTDAARQQRKAEKKIQKVVDNQ